MKNLQTLTHEEEEEEECKRSQILTKMRQMTDKELNFAVRDNHFQHSLSHCRGFIYVQLNMGGQQENTFHGS